MSLLGKLAKGVGQVLKKVAPIAARIIPGVGPVLAGVGAVSAIRTVAGAVGGTVRAGLPAIRGQLPSLGRAAVGGAVGGAVAGQIVDIGNGQMMVVRPRRRGRGFSSRDIRQTRRMLKLIREMQSACPRPRVARSR